MGIKVLVRSTVELSGFPRGQERVADVDVPRVRQLLDAGYVVLVNPSDALKMVGAPDVDVDGLIDTYLETDDA